MRSSMESQFTIGWALQVRAGNSSIILGLLEDIHRAYDGIGPRTTSKPPTKTPYLGKILHTIKPMRGPSHHERSHPDSLVDHSVTVTRGGGAGDSPLTLNTMGREEPVDLLQDMAALPLAAPSSAAEADRFMAEGMFSGGEVRGEVAGHPTDVHKTLTRRCGSPSRIIERVSAAGLLESDRRTLGTKAAVVQKPQHKLPHKPPLSLPGAGGLEDPLLPALAIDCGRLNRWLEIHGFALPAGLAHCSAGALGSFRDGTVLCDLASRLRHTAIEGVTRMARAPASRLYNIEKALQLLRDDVNMPTTYLWCGHDIEAGDPDVIVPLLEQMRKVYVSGRQSLHSPGLFVLSVGDEVVVSWCYATFGFGWS